MSPLLSSAFLTLLFLSMSSPQTEKETEEKQITHDLTYNHDLDNNDNFSPDAEWLVYDTRTDDGGIPESARIEKVNVKTGEIKVLFQVENNQVWGPGAGAVSYSPKENSVVFIHGLANSSKENPYQQWRRTGVIIQDSRPNAAIYMDARDVTFPFTPGALRGGTHRHEWSGDGQWIGFTYNDAIMKALEDATGKKRNLRTIGVSKKIKAVRVDKNAENVSGEWFSALVVRVVPEPKPGSDEISHAAGDSWVGTNGYLCPDGKRQIARAFLGTVVDKNGKNTPEVFVVDIPDDITSPGEHGPLEGTETDFPMPPKDTRQRRLTFTADSKYPGCSGIVRTSPDGEKLAYFAKDAKGILQIFSLSPNGGKPQQLTDHESDVSGNLRWHPDGKHVSYVWNGSVMLCQTGTAPFKDRYKTLTASSNPAPTNIVWAHDGKMFAFNKPVKTGNDNKTTLQVFVKAL